MNAEQDKISSEIETISPLEENPQGPEGIASQGELVQTQEEDAAEPEKTAEIPAFTQKKHSASNKGLINTLIIGLTFLVIALNGAVTILQTSENFVIAAFKLIFLFIISGLMTTYFYFFQKDNITETKNIILLACFLILGIVPSMYLMVGLPYLMPLLLVIMLIATVFAQDIALMYGFGAVLLVAALGVLKWTDIIIYLVMVLFSHQLLPYIRQRKNVIYIALASMASFGLLVMFGHLATLGSMQDFHWLSAVYAMVNGLVSVIFLMGSLPLWESAFDVVTPNKLMELANVNNDLLQRLLKEAPGTYHHSLMVSNLAEKAAIDLKLDALLAKTGAMYHDIGKLKTPQYFTENQAQENPHDFLPAFESAHIIIGHVAEGVKMAKKHRLPKAIIAFIQEHHGNRVMGQFYQKALRQNPGQPVDMAQFQYPGPKPQSKESAIVMMADVVEATIKSLPEYERKLDNIEQVIDQVTAHLIVENQLLESGLSFKEFDKAKASFLDVYRGLYHERIDYRRV